MRHYTHGTTDFYQGCYARHWYRTDTYHSDMPELDGQIDQLACIDAHDDTPIQETYSANCPGCWLNHTHTQAYHQKYVTH